MSPTKPLNASTSAMLSRAVKHTMSAALPSDNIDSGTPAIADAIAGLRIAYRSGLDIGACEIRVRKVAGTDTRERLVACTHAADTLARAFLNCRNVSKAAHYRGVGDAYAKAANLTDYARGLPLPLGGLELREVPRG